MEAPHPRTKDVLAAKDVRNCSLKRTRNASFGAYHSLKEDTGIKEERVSRTGKRTVRKVSNSRKVPGLTKRLQDLFYPGYRYSHSQGHGSGFGRELGQKVDRQITAYVNASRPKRAAMLRSMHHLARGVVQTMEIRGIRPVKAQVAVYDRTVGLATSLDIVGEEDIAEGGDGKDASRAKKPRSKVRTRPVVIEVKTGFDTYASAPGCGREKRMLFPLNDLPNCPENQHILQAAVGAEMLRRASERSGVLCAPSAYVFRAHGRDGSDAAVTVYPMPDWVGRRIEAVMAAIEHAK